MCCFFPGWHVGRGNRGQVSVSQNSEVEKGLRVSRYSRVDGHDILIFLVFRTSIASVNCFGCFRRPGLGSPAIQLILPRLFSAAHHYLHASKLDLYFFVCRKCWMYIMPPLDLLTVLFVLADHRLLPLRL